MGSTNHELTSRRSKRNHKQPGRAKDPVNWDIVPTKLIGDLIKAATRGGGAIRFGGTRDNGALALGVYGDGEYYAEYFRECEEFEEFAEELINVFNGIADSKE